MIHNAFTKAQDWLDDRLRWVCGQINPDMRLIIILILFLLFSGGSLYMTISAIYNIGKHSGEQMQIEHLERLNLKINREPLQMGEDSIQQEQFKNNHYERRKK